MKLKFKIIIFSITFIFFALSLYSFVEYVSRDRVSLTQNMSFGKISMPEPEETLTLLRQKKDPFFSNPNNRHLSHAWINDVLLIYLTKPARLYMDYEVTYETGSFGFRLEGLDSDILVTNDGLAEAKTIRNMLLPEGYYVFYSHGDEATEGSLRISGSIQ